MKVLRINARDTHRIRSEILRPGKSVDNCIFEGDDDDQTFHLGAFIENKLVSVASFYFDRHPDLDALYQYRLRGMATLPSFQRQGLSKALLKIGFPIVKQNQCSVVWCNAREEAMGFYQKVGFEKMGDKFEIPEVGPHFLMVKNIDH
ncbi:MAG: GNAT family N-acetyltransferase [Deltaproteobacteria bacterium]|nr:MAG: GNAT family N-acetyltransferase [Deltaproteobacteria bacterium]